MNTIKNDSFFDFIDEYDIIFFPLKEANYLKDIKLGKYDFTSVMDCIEKGIDEIKQLSDKSNLPNKVNKKATNKLLLDILEHYYN